MWEKDCGCLPVIEPEGRLVGMITDRDICMAAYTRGTPLGGESVESAMKRTVVTCAPDDTLGEVERLMKATQVRRIPVTNHQGVVVGIITVSDLARDEARPGERGQQLIGAAATLSSICRPSAPPLPAHK